jgi:uncharacterized protein YjbK
MSQNIEIEFKNMLTSAEYKMLLREFNIMESQIFTQENHYFDTRQFDLRERGTALRIRRKQEQYEMTLKQPLEVGLLETNQILSKSQAEAAMAEGLIPNGPIKELIQESGVSCSALTYFGSLTTNRSEVKYRNGLLVLDHSLFFDKEDYELEYEANDYLTGQESFKGLLQQYNIPERKTENKIKRFYNQKREIEKRNEP